MKLFSLLAAATALLFAPLAARADDDIMKHLVSVPSVGAYTIYGAKQTNKKVKDANVQGGLEMQVRIEGGGNPWDAAASVDVTKKIVKGDAIECYVWLKAKSDAGTPVTLHGRLQVNAAPYTAVGEKDFNVTEDWALYPLEVTADQDYDKGKLVFVIHLNTAKQTVDLGPAFVLDMTRTY